MGKPRKRQLVPGNQKDVATGQRTADGRFAVGWRGNLGGDGGRARRALNLATIEGMSRAFEKGGQAAIDKVMKQQPAIFLKMLVLLVPRELEVSHTNMIKQMTDEQIEAAIEAIQNMLARKADATKLIDAKPDASSSSTLDIVAEGNIPGHEEPSH